MIPWYLLQYYLDSNPVLVGVLVGVQSLSFSATLFVGTANNFY